MSLRIASAIVGALVGLQLGTAEAGVTPPEGALVNGDVNCDADIDLSDAVYLLSWTFLGGPAPCPAAGNSELLAQVAELEAEVVACESNLEASQAQLIETTATLTDTVTALLDSEAELDTTRAERDAFQAQVLSLEQELVDT